MSRAQAVRLSPRQRALRTWAREDLPRLARLALFAAGFVVWVGGGTLALYTLFFLALGVSP